MVNISIDRPLPGVEAVDDVEETGPAEAAVYNISIVSLLAPKTDTEGKLGHPPNRIDLNMANSPR